MRVSTFALCFLVARSLAGQSSPVAVVVTDSATHAGVDGARISIDGRADEPTTDDRGRVAFSVPVAGRLSFLVRRLGYNPRSVTVDVIVGDTTRVTLAMKAAPQSLANVDVRDTLSSNLSFLQGFERRRSAHAGSATYFTRSDIEKYRPQHASDLLRRSISIMMIDSAGVLLPASRRSQKAVVLVGHNDLAPCVMQVAVDGTPKEWGFAVNSLSPEEIHGIEIYPGPSTIPAEFASMRRDAACGLVMIWTRRDR